MIKVSYINGEYNIGIDLSDRGAEVFEITQEEFGSIQSGKADIVDGNVVYRKEEKKSKKLIQEENESIEREKKASLIVQKYTITDQINHIRRVLQTLSKDEQINEMGKYIDGILKSDLSSNGGDNVQ